MVGVARWNRYMDEFCDTEKQLGTLQGVISVFFHRFIRLLPTHTQYQDGTPRPLLRGVLQCSAMVITVPSTVAIIIFDWPRCAAAVPGLCVICYGLVCSSLIHMYPWKTKKREEHMTRLDYYQFPLAGAASLMIPQLTGNPACHPSIWYSVILILVPTSLQFIATVIGSTSPVVQTGCLIATVAAIFSPMPSNKIWWWRYVVLFSGSSYVLGLVLHTCKPCKGAKYWGYHEWMHLSVTIGIAINYWGLIKVAHECYK